MDVSAWHCSYFSGVLTSQPTQELMLHRFIFSFLCAAARHIFFCNFFLSHLSSDLLTADLCVSQAFCYSSLKMFALSLSLSLSVRSSWPFAGVWSWQTMPMNDEWWLEVCLVPTECIIQHADSDSCPSHWTHAAVIVSYQWRICPQQITVTAWSGNHQKPASRYVWTYCVNLQFFVRGVLKEC